MWEISSGSIAFSKYDGDDQNLVTGICLNGLRPNIHESTATCYAELLKQCWDNDPNKRPTALEIYETITNWRNDSKILSEFKKFDKEIVVENDQSNINVDDNLIYSSKLIDFITNDGISDNLFV
ncbi:hypothetical protein C2G38_1997388, partial [Gigaspora rosea]